MGEAGFWDDQQGAAAISTEHARIARRLERYERLRREYDDARELLAMDGDMAADIQASLEPLEQELERLQEDALFSGDYDAGDAVVTIQSDAGGTDAQDFTELLLRMYLRWAADRGFRTEVLEASPGEEAGLKSATFTVEGENAYGILKAERGKHRLVRLSPYDSAHRRHTSFAQVIPSPLLTDDAEIEVDESEVRVDTYRASGAGGQHVNKTDSAVRITHLPTGVVVSVQNERSQSSNKATAMNMLKSKLLELEEQKRREEIAKEKGEAQDVAWGSQIRSYVLHPYTMAKDHRTNHEVGNVQGVLDGDLDGFVRAELLRRAGSTNGA
jgi:peptide chain release factor 2